MKQQRVLLRNRLSLSAHIILVVFNGAFLCGFWYSRRFLIEIHKELGTGIERTGLSCFLTKISVGFINHVGYLWFLACLWILTLVGSVVLTNKKYVFLLVTDIAILILLMVITFYGCSFPSLILAE